MPIPLYLILCQRAITQKSFHHVRYAALVVVVVQYNAHVFRDDLSFIVWASLGCNYGWYSTTIIVLLQIDINPHKFFSNERTIEISIYNLWSKIEHIIRAIIWIVTIWIVTDPFPLEYISLNNNYMNSCIIQTYVTIDVLLSFKSEFQELNRMSERTWQRLLSMIQIFANDVGCYKSINDRNI